MIIEEIIKLIVCIMGAVGLYVIIAIFSGHTILYAFQMVGQALKWEVQTVVGRINLAGIIFAFYLILALPIQDFILELLNNSREQQQSGVTNELGLLYICFCLFTLGSMHITARFEEHRRQMDS